MTEDPPVDGLIFLVVGAPAISYVVGHPMAEVEFTHRRPGRWLPGKTQTAVVHAFGDVEGRTFIGLGQEMIPVTGGKYVTDGLDPEVVLTTCRIVNAAVPQDQRKGPSALWLVWTPPFPEGS